MIKRLSYILCFFALCLTSGTLLAQQGESKRIQAENPIVQQSSINISNKIEVYPNPAVEYLVIEIQNSELVDTEFEMHSIIGNEIKIEPEEIGQDVFRIPVKNFSTGYYFLVVKDEITRYKKAFKFLKK